MKEKLQFCLDKISLIRSKLPKKKPHSEKYYKMIAFLNKYSLVFHFILACVLTFAIEVISRRDFLSTISFLHNHTLAYLYNAFIVFASLSIVYLFRCRAQLRVLISGLWLFLGTINGLILSNRVTPFSYTVLKCISDLFAMQNTNYFTAEEATLVVGVVVAFFVFLGFFFAKGPKYQGKRHFVLGPVSIAALLLVGLPITTQAAQGSNILASYFSNIAQGYADYGFVYGFSTSVVGRGMSKPDDYSEETVDAIETLVNSSKEQTTVSKGSEPNIICVLLESFADPYEVNFLNMSEDPIPNFHNLESNYSTGYLTVPVVGAGTANTEFEVLTGMSMQYFGTGEYPYKTILKQTDCESIASDLSKIGYGTHVVHNNTATFYSRNNAFSMMGFDTFTSKELMNITQYTPNGNWPTDDVLVQETVKTLDSTKDQSDFVYTITVEGHGDYPTEKILTDPAIKVSGAATEESNNQWEYYVNMIHEVDDFIGDLITAVDRRGEDTIVVMFGDHLPTMGLSSWQNYIMPVAALAFYPTAYIMRLMRSSMLDVLGQDYMRTAKAKGLSGKVQLFKHALRNAILPVVTYVGPMLAYTVTGSFVVEKIFTIPGLGGEFIGAIQGRDYTLIMGTTIFLATLIIVMNVVVDIVYKLIDPRITLK